MQSRGWRGLVFAAGALVALLGLYALVGFVVLPSIVRHDLLSYAQQLPGSHLDVGAVRANPFTLTAQIDDLVLRRKPGGSTTTALAADTPMMGFHSLTVTVSAASVWRRAWDVRRITLERPSVQVLINTDGTLELPLAAAGGGRSSAGSAESAWPSLILERLEIQAGALRLIDRNHASPVRLALDPINLALADLRTAPGSEGNYRLSAVSAAGERLQWSGRFSLRPATSSGQFVVQGLKLATLAPYLPASMPVTAQGGSIALHGDYRWASTPAQSLQLHLADLTLRGSALLARAGASPAATATATVTVTAAAAATGAGAGAGAGVGVGGTPLLSLPEIDVSDATLALPAQRLAIGSVRIVAPSVRARRGADGQVDVLQLMSGAAAGAAPQAASAAQPWTLQLARLSVEGATLQLQDDAVSPAALWRVQPLSLTLQGYSSQASAPMMLSLDTGLGSRGRLAVQANLVRSPLQASAQLDLTGFSLPILQSYLPRNVALRIYRGQLGAQAAVQYAASPAPGQPHLSASGTLSLSDFGTRDEVLQADFLSGKLVQLSGVRYQQGPDALSVQRVLARGIYARVLIGPDGRLNLSKILAAQSAAPALAPAYGGRPATLPQANAASASIPIRIARVDVQNGSADFTDRSVQPNFSSAILGLHGSIVGLSSDPQSRASLNLQGSVDRYAPVSIVGQVNPLAASTYSDVTMQFQNIELPTFNPYSGKFAGYSIAQGKLSTQMHYHVDHGRLDATHHVEIDQLEFGPPTASKQAVPLPVKLAAALLKDRRGVISIDLPVSGTLDDPKFRLGPLIWKAFVGLVTKAVTAPFAWLGSLVGGGQQLAYVDFAPDSAELAPAQAQKLMHLAQALAARPQLSLNVPLHTESDLDDRAFAEAALQQALQAASVEAAAADKTAATGARRSRRRLVATLATSGADPGAGAADPNRALVLLYRQQFHGAPHYPQELADAAARATWLEQQLLPAFVPSRVQRDALARARAEATEAAVLKNSAVSASRVFLVQRVSGGGPAGVVRMELQLQ